MIRPDYDSYSRLFEHLTWRLVIGSGYDEHRAVLFPLTHKREYLVRRSKFAVYQDAVGTRAERLAAAVRRGQSGLAVEDRQRRREQQVDAGHQRLVAVAGPQALGADARGE